MSLKCFIYTPDCTILHHFFSNFLGEAPEHPLTGGDTPPVPFPPGPSGLEKTPQVEFSIRHCSRIFIYLFIYSAFLNITSFSSKRRIILFDNKEWNTNFILCIQNVRNRNLMSECKLELYVTCNDISVIYGVTQMCRRTEEKVVPTVIMPSLNIRISSNASAFH